MSEPEDEQVRSANAVDAPAMEATYTYADGSKDTAGTFLRRAYLDPVTLILIVATAGLAVWGVLRTVSEPDDKSFLTVFLIVATAVLPTAWSVLSVLWKESADVAIMVALVRTIIVPLVVAWPPALAVAITVHLPAVQQQMADTAREDGWRYFFGEGEMGLLAQAMVLTGLGGMLFAILTGLVLSVFVVLPILAWLKPLAAAKSNMLLTDTADEQVAAKSGIRMLSVILMMTFGVPALIIIGKNEALANSWFEAFANVPQFIMEPRYYYGDLMWALGILAIPFGIYLIIRLKRVQRADIAKRAQYGVNSDEDHQTWLESQKTGGGTSGTLPENGPQNEPK